MRISKCFVLKIIGLAFCAVLNAFLFYKSLGVSYQWLLAHEHIRFRPEMPTQDEWVNSPLGRLKTYMFNVTNGEAYLNGTDERIKLQEVGPIVYKIDGYNDIMARNETTLTYRKHRFRRVQFMPEESVSPDILNQTIVIPDMVVLGSLIVAKHYLSLNPLKNLPFFQTKTSPMNSLTQSGLLSTDNFFLSNSIYYYLWEYTSHALKAAEKLSTLSSECGLLRNALTEKKEIYNVKIGTKNGLDNFFRVMSLNNNTVFPEQIDYASYLRPGSRTQCPIDVCDGLDNSLYPPFLKPDTKLKVVAVELCRTMSLKFKKFSKHDGLTVHQYTFGDDDDVAGKPSCLDKTYDFQLPNGMFDISKCVINKAPTAFSSPHFYGSAYNWSEHFEGLKPNAEDHEPMLLIEPITGIPLMEHYRFQSNMPLPDLGARGSRLAKLNRKILPIFWYEFQMNELSTLVKSMIRFNVLVMPVLQPILMALYILLSILSLLKIALLFKGITIWQLLTRSFGGTSNIRLETTFPRNVTLNASQMKTEAQAEAKV